MAPIANPTPKSRTGGRKPGRPPKHDTPAAEPAKKKRRYVPGGPGGGGRYVDFDASAGSVTTPRSRNARTSSANRRSVAPRASPSTVGRPRRERPVPTTPRYNSAADAAAAVTHSEGYKPREERGWEEFHQDLDIDAPFVVYNADEIDGIRRSGYASPSQALETANGPFGQHVPSMLEGHLGHSAEDTEHHPGTIDVAIQSRPSATYVSPPKRRPGRPPRRPESMLTGLGSPPAPRILPIPLHGPREKLTLPKPSYRRVDIWAKFEQDKVKSSINFVDGSMSKLGYQESDRFTRTEPTFNRYSEASMDEDLESAIVLKSDPVEGEPTFKADIIGKVEYDMDEQDEKWLDDINARRKAEGVEGIKPSMFEITITQIEKEWHALEKRIPKPNPKPPQTARPRSSSAAAVNGEPAGNGEEPDSKCAVCDDGDCENTNAIVFCDGCDLAVHQECYGVPFIPEGQWLCRRCQLLGRGTATCIFCPNPDGAFKQTNNVRWAHLLCAIWIPEVSLGNTTFMEPVMDVEKVPNSRWKLTCYICKQTMGACIQCGNKNCYTAFHVTCARKAKLFLKMKSPHGGIGTLDSSVLKAFCDKHVPSEWRRENDVDTALLEAKETYRLAFRGRRWAEAQELTAAADLAASNASDIFDENGLGEDGSRALAGTKRKRDQVPKNVWRLPSGAPIVPAIVFNNVESSLSRFALRKRKEFAAEACKYWTMKREARRGASLIKRLQLQMETYSSMEVTRRNFVGMGAAGRPRLARRIEFAEKLLGDMENHLLRLCELVKVREEMKLRDARLCKHIVDIVYFPIPQLLRPILREAQTRDTKGVFREGLQKIEAKLEECYYTSVMTFSNDIASCFGSVDGHDSVRDTIEAHSHLNDTSGSSSGLTAEQKERRKAAKKISKAIHEPLEDAIRKEAELARKPGEQEIMQLDAMLEKAMLSRLGSPGKDGEGADDASDDEAEALSGVSPATLIADSSLLSRRRDEVEMDGPAPAVQRPDATHLQVIASMEKPTIDGRGERVDARASSKAPSPAASNDHHGMTTALPAPVVSSHTISLNGVHALEPLTPPNSEKDLLAPFAYGGIPWYMEHFDPVGTTIQDERWGGRDALREMTEELSELDDEEMQVLEDEGLEDANMQDGAIGNAEAEATAARERERRRKARKKARRYY